jgi:hypothetical protein
MRYPLGSDDPLVSLLEFCKRLNPQKERDERFPRTPAHLISAGFRSWEN